MLIHHGSNDPVISVEFARQANESLSDAGLAVRYLETDAGHWLPPEVLPRAAAMVGAATSPPANVPDAPA